MSPQPPRAASGGDEFERDCEQVWSSYCFRNQRLGAQGKAGRPGNSPDDNEQEAASEADGEDEPAGNAPHEKRPTQLHLSANNEERAETPPFREVLGRDREVHKPRGSSTCPSNRHGRRQPPPNAHSQSRRGNDNCCPQTPTRKAQHSRGSHPGQEHRLPSRLSQKADHKMSSPTNNRTVR